MLPLRTILKSISYPFTIEYPSQFLLLGSCFTENIGKKLQAAKFQTNINPFGILYNPLSILDNLERAVQGLDLPKNVLFEHQGYWYSHLHHSQFSANSNGKLNKQIQSQDQLIQNQFSTINYLIFSFGTAKVYEHKTWGKIVANCHKLPTREFESHLLSSREIADRYLVFLETAKTQNEQLEVLFTLSPVRHIRDGIIENQRSKAILLTAIHEICEELKFVHYFPSYELLMDDLRDYRFYERDLVHPSEMAIDYIWDYLQKCLFSSDAQQLYEQIIQVKQAASHRPFQPTSNAHQKFVRQQIEKVKQFQKQYTFLDWQEELAIFQAQLT
ncbi:MAG: GSCFA domain-containing protein [Bacteroidota bacterium]